MYWEARWRFRAGRRLDWLILALTMTRLYPRTVLSKAMRRLEAL